MEIIQWGNAFVPAAIVQCILIDNAAKHQRINQPAVTPERQSVVRGDAAAVADRPAVSGPEFPCQ